MNYFLDTNICVYFLKGSYNSIEKNIRKFGPDKIKIPSIVKAELLLGALKSNNPQKNNDFINQFLQPFEIIAFDNTASEQYAEIRAHLEKKGKVIGPNDLIIASCVLASNGTLVTNNTREFNRVPHLTIENWV